MEIIPRQQILDCLLNNWQPYLSRVFSLTPQSKIKFLDKQGYPTVSGLLGHIVAWWREGEQYIIMAKKDPSLPLPHYNVDEFNAQAVIKYGDMEELEITREYQFQLQAMVNLVDNLSDDEIKKENINTRLFYDIVSHWDEHRIALS